MPILPPLFVLGAPRSGTTVLYKSLCLHPDTVWVSNWERQAPRLEALAALNRLAALAPRTRRRTWFGAEGATAYAYGRRRTLTERLFPQPVEGEPVFAAFDVPQVSAATQGRGRQQRLPQSLRRRARWAGGTVPISKRIAHNTRVPLLHALFPDAPFVVITRDGRAVASSLARVDWWQESPLWWYDGTPASWVASGGDPVELCARHWVQEVRAIDAGLAALPEDQVLRIRYEDLVREPREVLATVARHAGLPASSRWQAALDQVRFPDQNDAWRTRLGDAAARVESVQKDELQARGYL